MDFGDTGLVESEILASVKDKERGFALEVDLDIGLGGCSFLQQDFHFGKIS